MRKIAIIELFGHFETLLSCYQAVNEHQAADFLLFTTRDGWQLLAPCFESTRNVALFLKERHDSNADFISRHLNLLNDTDLVIFTTLEGNYRFFSNLELATRSLLVVHNGNFWLDDIRNLKISSWRDLGRLAKQLVSLQFHFRRQIIRKVGFIALPDPGITAHFRRLRPDLCGKLLPPCPFYFPVQNLPFPPASDWVNIVIPGSLDTQRRQYDPVFQALRQVLGTAGLPRRIRLTLLGRPVGRRGVHIARLFAGLQRHGVEIQTFGTTVGQQEYLRNLSRADFLVLPLRGDLRYGICRELGGRTKISGTVNDALRVQRPALVDGSYALESRWQDLFSTYSDADDLAVKLRAWIVCPPMPIPFGLVLAEGKKDSQEFISALF